MEEPALSQAVSSPATMNLGAAPKLATTVQHGHGIAAGGRSPSSSCPGHACKPRARRAANFRWVHSAALTDSSNFPGWHASQKNKDIFELGLVRAGPHDITLQLHDDTPDGTPQLQLQLQLHSNVRCVAKRTSNALVVLTKNCCEPATGSHMGWDSKRITANSVPGQRHAGWSHCGHVMPPGQIWAGEACARARASGC